MIEPYEYVRLVTLLLASVWTLRGLWRALSFVRAWERRLAGVGASAPWLRRKVFVVLVRATVLDPVNLALLLVLVGIWTRVWAPFV